MKTGQRLLEVGHDANALVPSLPRAHDNIIQPQLQEKDDLEEPGDVEPHGLQAILMPLRVRLIAFSFVLFFSTGAAFAESTIGPLKSTLMRELGMNSTCTFAIASRGHME